MLSVIVDYMDRYGCYDVLSEQLFYIYTYIYICVYIYVYIYVYMCISMCVCVSCFDNPFYLVAFLCLFFTNPLPSDCWYIM